MYVCERLLMPVPVPVSIWMTMTFSDVCTGFVRVHSSELWTKVGHTTSFRGVGRTLGPTMVMTVGRTASYRGKSCAYECI
mmetsp:Transcript_638/g.833  ORF Transcript_638/g.833 Transcript_638/m.833 type:complete len:80 (-) Transcript_638:448-687(-)